VATIPAGINFPVLRKRFPMANVINPVTLEASACPWYDSPWVINTPDPINKPPNVNPATALIALNLK
jgi:hypothetical protein